METIWFYIIVCIKWWRKILPHRLIIRVGIMIIGLGSNVQAQQLQIEQMYARLRYNSCFMREMAREIMDEVRTEEK
ncbi:MAG: hypothetical protein FD123_2326 [Bacteroidetes bacterium]|nr:MAG: hypothetical protein FD123_2326 [Bacteroidota bacterium]